MAIRTEGMIEDLVRNLKSKDSELQRHCASAIFKVWRKEMLLLRANPILKLTMDLFHFHFNVLAC